MAELYRPDEYKALIVMCENLMSAEKGQHFDSVRARPSFAVCRQLAAVLEHRLHLFDYSSIIDTQETELFQQHNDLTLYDPMFLIEHERNRVVNLPVKGVQTIQYFTVVPYSHVFVTEDGERTYSYDGPHIYCMYDVPPVNARGLRSGSYLATLALDDVQVSASHQLGRMN